RSFSECTAKSTSPERILSRSALTKTPVPPIWATRALETSPCVVTPTSSTGRPVRSVSRSATRCDCVVAIRLLRVPSRSGTPAAPGPRPNPSLNGSLRSAPGGRRPRRPRSRSVSFAHRRAVRGADRPDARGLRVHRLRVHAPQLVRVDLLHADGPRRRTCRRLGAQAVGFGARRVDRGLPVPPGRGARRLVLAHVGAGDRLRRLRVQVEQ